MKYHEFSHDIWKRQMDIVFFETLPHINSMLKYYGLQIRMNQELQYNSFFFSVLHVKLYAMDTT